jgi:hypothetical protein
MSCHMPSDNMHCKTMWGLVWTEELASPLAELCPHLGVSEHDYHDRGPDLVPINSGSQARV